MSRETHSNDYITKLFYILRRKGVADDIKHYCVLELLHWHEITTDQAYEYLGLSQEELEEKFNNITNKKSKEK
jgi:hypothetical protein